jgi:hypothetical protein
MSPSTGTRECREFASEIKFLVNPAFAEQIRVWARARLLPDPYGPIRLTLDEDLRALPAAGLWFSEQEGILLLKDQVILEMKFCCGMPSIFKYLVEEFALTPKPISKYRLAMAALGLVDLPASATREDCNPQYA